MAITNGTIAGRTFSASGLLPFTEYTFQVAGSNSAGMGDFTDVITLFTDTSKWRPHLLSLVDYFFHHAVPGPVYNSMHATTSGGTGNMSTADDVAIPTAPTPRELALCDTVHGLCE